MTEAEIKKALECCVSDNPPCTTCKYDGDTITVDECMGKLMKDALDLINRQQAENKAFGEIMKKQDDEISELRKELLKRQNLEEFFSKERKQFDKKMLKQVKRERAEAVKEFIKKLEEKKHECGCNYRKKPVYAITEEKICETYKEMVGDAE